MILLQEIIDLATNNQTPLSVLLRKCLVLSTVLKNDALKEWVGKELNGYNDDDAFPEYRVLTVHAKGYFRGPMGASLNNEPLPAGILEEKYRKWATTNYTRESVAALDHFIQQPADGQLRCEWPADLVVRYQTKFIRGYVLAAAWQEIPFGAIVAINDTIRNRVLTFALEINDALDVAHQDASAVSNDRVTQQVTNIIYGGNNVFAAKAHDFSQEVSINVGRGDIDGLVAALVSVGVKDERIGNLKRAIEDDKKVPATDGIGPGTSSWLARTLANVGQEGLKIGGDAARAAITRALLSYAGLG